MALMFPDCRDIVRLALQEDIGTGDVTTQFTISPETGAVARMIVKQGGWVAGLPLVSEVYRQIDPEVAVTELVEEGSAVVPGTFVCQIEGRAQSVLTGERVALNFVQRLSGIATKTAQMVSLVAGTGVRVVDTRKTTPGLRVLEKYAVRAGGGHNHRFGLYDAVMIKDNHIRASGSITQAVANALAQAPHTMTVTVECDTLEQVREAVEASADIILLDNMTLDELRAAVEIIDGQAAAEASGGVTENTIADIAATGVNIISVGALTHSATALDISLEFSA
jgi:nicotinate-nucleotide pyrophosphorylase (carboxylating)